MQQLRNAAIYVAVFVACSTVIFGSSPAYSVAVLVGYSVGWVAFTALGAVLLVMACRVARLTVIGLTIGSGPGRTLRPGSGCPVRLGSVPAGFCAEYVSSDRSHLARRAWLTDAATAAPPVAAVALLLLVGLPTGLRVGIALATAKVLWLLVRRPTPGSDGGAGWRLLAGRPNLDVLYAPPAEVPFRRLAALGHCGGALAAAADVHLTPEGQARRAYCLMVVDRPDEAIDVLRRLDRSQLTGGSRFLADNNALSTLCLLAERGSAPVGWTAEGWVVCGRLRAERRWRAEPAACATVANFLALAGHPDEALPLTERRAVRNTVDALLTRALAQDLLGHHEDAATTLARVTRAGVSVPRLAAVRELVGVASA